MLHGGFGCVLSNVIDRRDPECVGPVILADRDIGADDELVALQMQYFFVLGIEGAVVVEGPTAALFALETANLVFRPLAESDDPAKVAMLLPGLDIDPCLSVQRKDQDITISRAAFGMTFFARQFEADAPKVVRQWLVLGLRMGGGIRQNTISFEVEPPRGFWSEVISLR